MLKRFGVGLLITFIGICCLEAGDRLAESGEISLVGSAEARVGRPLTPVSVAGVARRTTRRCAAGVYNC